ncbi:MAG: tryptophan 2,3-dioxygenase family protein [Planctomycetota bacterium]|nr:tryptophan 2,3-dioxygenase family protein [Planctomycetota bacterium]
MAFDYSTYLSLDALLDLQKPRSEPPEHDETLFIVIHQVYELWFKELLHEFAKIKQEFSNDDLFGAIATFKRVRTIMKTLVGQLDILETMTSMSFNSFRERLEDASGFQSIQFRELEFVLGYKRPDTLKYHDHNPAGREALRRRLEERSVVDHFYDFIEHRGVSIPAGLRARDPSEPAVANEQIQEGVLGLYIKKPELAILFELMTDFDEGMQEWRYRHIKLVERTIGHKRGTGGSPGVPFLKASLFKPIFPDLWAIRHRF